MHRIWGWKLLGMPRGTGGGGTGVRAEIPIRLPIPGAPHGIYPDIWQDSHSGMWLGTIDDVVRFDGEHFYSLRPYGFPKEIPNGFAEDSDGGIWIATQGTDVGGGNGSAAASTAISAGRVEKELAGDGLGLVPLGPGLMLAAIGHRRPPANPPMAIWCFFVNRHKAGLRPRS
jgi:hypothetical protein